MWVRFMDMLSEAFADTEKRLDCVVIATAAARSIAQFSM